MMVQLASRVVIAAAAFFLPAARAAHAQYMPHPFPTTAPVAIALEPEASVPLGGLLGNGERDHRYLGFYLGLAAGAILGAYAVAECAGQSECAVTPVPFGLLVLLVLPVAGALVGSLIPK
jgi:hypothetical protein